jgi:hypothetical protein
MFGESANPDPDVESLADKIYALRPKQRAMLRALLDRRGWRL